MYLRDVSSAARGVTRRRALAGLGAIVASSTPSSSIAQQTFPSRPISFIIPGVPGGGFDPVARAISEHASTTLGQRVVLEHKPGGTMTLGPATMAATAKPDGYTIGMIVSTIVRIPLMQKVAYNPFDDFTHIMQVCEVSVGVVTRADRPFKSLQDITAYAREHPGTLTYGSPGVGSGAHFAMEHMARSAGVSLTHVPFRGSPEGIAAVLGGHIALFVSAFEWKPQVAAGELRLLAVLAESRRATWPDVPTFKEQGFAQSLRPASFGIAGPRGMDPAIVRRLHDAFKSALDDKAVGAILERHELVPSYLNAKDYRRRLEEDTKVDAELVAALGLKRKE